MYIRANQIAAWATTKDAQASLGRLLRNLVHAGGLVTQVAFPAGDSASTPGWDGEVVSQYENAWVVRGKSFWEFSCEGRPATKATSDYEKRTRETSELIRSDATIVIVSARRWSNKRKWIEIQRARKEWNDVRAYDADDLEQWLEQSPGVALRFADELGIAGPGVESLAKHWENWSQQSDPPISADGLFVDRTSTRDRLLEDVRSRICDGGCDPYAVRADSVEEAAAFVCAALLTQPELSSSSLVVTDESGWRFVEQNTTLKIVVAAGLDAALKPTRRRGLAVVIPYASGDAGQGMNAVGQGFGADLILERPRVYEFKKALGALGLDEGEAERLATSTGRSWSVFRRRRATNPAIRRPAWLDASEARALSTVCLLGGWITGRAADREIASRLSGRSHEELEKDLRFLAGLDDAPILEIGQVWMAKSPLELIDLFGDRIAREELDRFFEITDEILRSPDPELELPDEKRYAAEIYGKTRPQSGLLLQNLCETLIKLAVRGLQVPALSSINIDMRVSSTIRKVFEDADQSRWLSLSSSLPLLAEAAPDAFLEAIERSLTEPDRPVTSLLTETNAAGFMGRCWHAGLLWGLEILAWAPDRLSRVALLLARLAHVEVKGNWGNSPLGSLVNIFRSWLPQTAADISRRIATLDILIDREPDIAFELLDHLVYRGQDTASPSVRPKWRDDDTGAGRGVPPTEQAGMLIAAADRLLACGRNNPRRIAGIISKIDVFDDARIGKVVSLAAEFTTGPDEDKAIIRDALREWIHWHRNYDKLEARDLEDKVRPIEDLYRRLSPDDPVIRDRWLFSNQWPQLPIRVRDDDHNGELRRLEAMRTDALQEIYAKQGLRGVEQLAAGCASLGAVGVTMAKLSIPTAVLKDWIANGGGDFTSSEPLTPTIWGLLRALPAPVSGDLVRALVVEGQQRGWTTDKIARLLALAPDDRSTWNIVTSCGPDGERAYWKIAQPQFWLRTNGADFQFAIRRLLEAGRPRSAFHLCHLDLEKIDSQLIFEMLERMLVGEELDAARLDSYHLAEAVKRLESDAVDRDRLIRLEFNLIPALGYQEEHNAESLYKALMSDPKLFVELICILYKPANAEREATPTAANKNAAGIAYQVLRACHRQPGTQADGNIDPAAFVTFIDEARRLCREADRLAVCDQTLGQILAHAQADPDGTWPFQPARTILDRPGLDEMRRGFRLGVVNSRGVTTRNPDEGGGQERQLAEMYRKRAEAVADSSVYLAAMIADIARQYEADGRHEDLSASLRRESY